MKEKQEKLGGDVGMTGQKVRGAFTLSPCYLVTLSLCSAVALGVLLFALLRTRNTEQRPQAGLPDPRLTYTGLFRNVNPNVHYVADEHCGKCHADIAASYAEHPMGRSLFPVAQAPVPPIGAREKNPFEAFGSLFRVEYEGDQVRHIRTRKGVDGRPAAAQSWDVHYVIGSGTRGYSYLSDRDGYLFQTPISWYAQKKAWDLSPGFRSSTLTGRAIMADCLFCHANRADYVEGSVNRYRSPVFEGHAIGCQRCHGPGEVHVSEPGAVKGDDGTDYTIVNPKRLTLALRDGICEQCHLQGAGRVAARGRGLYDFRPGLPLESFWSVFVRTEAGGTRKAIGQVEQMYQSRCFRDSEGPQRLGCVSCHDPHKSVRPAERIEHYRAACNSTNCHQRHGCSVAEVERRRTSAQDSCIDCHMPRYGAADIPHTAATDHRILRNGKPVSLDGAAKTPADSLLVAAFYSGRSGVEEVETDRDRAVLLMELAVAGDASSAKSVRSVLPVLEAACRCDPDDLPAGEARGYALALRNASDEALAAFQAVLDKAPDRELALAGAGLAAEALAQTETALAYWRRAVAVNPWSPGYRRSLALLSVKQEAWADAAPECAAWVRLDPFSAEARAARVACLLAIGDKNEARAEFQRVEALAPPNLRELQIRFGKKLKRPSPQSASP